MKRVWKIVITLAICLVVAAIVLMLSLDSLVLTAMEKVGTAVLGAETTVKSVSISIVGGSAEIKGLTIANPEGYGDGNLLELGRIKVALKPASLLGSTVVVSEITVEAPVVKLKQQGLETNLGVVMKNASGEGEAKPAEKKEKAPAKGKQFKVAVITVKDAQVEYALGGAPAAKIPLPDIQMRDISNADGSPLMLKDIVVQVMAEMTKNVGNAIGGEIKEGLTSATKAGAEAAKKAVEGVGGAAKKAAEGVGSLFKDLGKKEKK